MVDIFTDWETEKAFRCRYNQWLPEIPFNLAPQEVENLRRSCGEDHVDVDIRIGLPRLVYVWVVGELR